jgi:hypothetical protein
MKPIMVEKICARKAAMIYRPLIAPWGTLDTHQSSDGRRRLRLAENPTIKPTSKTPDPARNHLIY